MIAACLIVEFAVTGDDCPLARAARETGVSIDAHPSQLRTDDNALLRFSAPVPDVTADDAPAANETAASLAAEDRTLDPAQYGPVAEVLDADERVRYLHAAADGDRVAFRCLSKRPCVVHALTDAGFMVESIRYAPAEERHRGAVVGYDVLRGVLSVGADRSEEGDGVSVSVERVHPLGTEDQRGTAARRWSITPRQEAALRTALAMGYFAVPRETDAAEVAAELGVSKSAFLERLRRGQRSLLEQVL